MADIWCSESSAAKQPSVELGAKSARHTGMVPAMAIKACPFCGVNFDEQKHRYNPHPLQRIDPIKAADNLFTVRCPNCARVYVSSSVKFLGFVTRRTYFAFFLAL